MGNEESIGAVLVAGAANLGIAVSKAVGGVISGSSAMLSEAAHSVADTVTEVLLFIALKRGRRPEGASLLRGLRQVRAEAAGISAPLLRYLRDTPDTTVKAVVLEDSAALLGLLLAAGGLLGAQPARSPGGRQGRLPRRRHGRWDRMAARGCRDHAAHPAPGQARDSCLRQDDHDSGNVRMLNTSSIRVGSGVARPHLAAMIGYLPSQAAAPAG